MLCYWNEFPFLRLLKHFRLFADGAEVCKYTFAAVLNNQIMHFQCSVDWSVHQFASDWNMSTQVWHLRLNLKSFLWSPDFPYPNPNILYRFNVWKSYCQGLKELASLFCERTMTAVTNHILRSLHVITPTDDTHNATISQRLRLFHDITVKTTAEKPSVLLLPTLQVPTVKSLKVREHFDSVHQVHTWIWRQIVFISVIWNQFCLHVNILLLTDPAFIA